MNGWIHPWRASRNFTVVICTYERPEHLRRGLVSLAVQRDLPEGFEIVVTDDGSSDATADVVAEFAKTVDIPIAWTSHPHEGYQVARTRNDGARLARGRYLLLLDGDCIVPQDHIAQHIKFRRPRTVVLGDCCRFDEEQSQRVTDEVIESGEFVHWAPRSERRRLWKRHLKSYYYKLIGRPCKPPLIGNNVGLWREDYVRVNGFDENFREWGCEDDDFGRRLHWAGVRTRSILAKTWAYHLWHEPHPTVPTRWRDGRNVSYFLSRAKAPRCENGLLKTPELVSDVA